MNTATPAPINATTAAMPNAILKPSTDGTFVPGSVCAASSAAPTWPPTTPPTVRITVFIPVATPVSVGRTASVMSVAMAAKAKPTPTPSTGMAARICHGLSCHSVSEPAEIDTSSMPAASGHLKPTRRPMSPASGPANSRVTELGSRYRPAFVALASNP